MRALESVIGHDWALFPSLSLPPKGSHVFLLLHVSPWNPCCSGHPVQPQAGVGQGLLKSAEAWLLMLKVMGAGEQDEDSEEGEQVACLWLVWIIFSLNFHVCVV